jgi:hypothetical protein
VGFVVDKVALGQVFLLVLLFPLPIFIPPTAPHPLFGVGGRGPIVADIPSGHSLTTPKEIKKKKLFSGVWILNQKLLQRLRYKKCDV